MERHIGYDHWMLKHDPQTGGTFFRPKSDKFAVYKQLTKLPLMKNVERVDLETGLLRKHEDRMNDVLVFTKRTNYFQNIKELNLKNCALNDQFI